ncbi:hypothetical protein [Streptococcus phocae]
MRQQVEDVKGRNNFEKTDELRIELEVITKQNKKKSSITYDFNKHIDTVNERCAIGNYY